MHIVGVGGVYQIFFFLNICIVIKLKLIVLAFSYTKVYFHGGCVYIFYFIVIVYIILY